jgi:hypothetical protein
MKARLIQLLSAVCLCAAILALWGWARSHSTYDVVLVDWGRTNTRAVTWPGRVVVEYIHTHSSPGGGPLQFERESGPHADMPSVCPAPQDATRGNAFAYNRSTTTSGVGLFGGSTTTTHTTAVPFWFLAAAPASVPLLRLARRCRPRRNNRAAFPVSPPPPAH